MLFIELSFISCCCCSIFQEYFELQFARVKEDEDDADVKGPLPDDGRLLRSALKDNVNIFSTVSPTSRFLTCNMDFFFNCRRRRRLHLQLQKDREEFKMLCDEVRHVMQAAASKRSVRLPPAAISVNVGALPPNTISPTGSQAMGHQAPTPTAMTAAAPSPYTLVVPPPAADGVTPVKPRGGRGRKSSKNVRPKRAG